MLVLLINFILHQACNLLIYLLTYCEINKIMESVLSTTWLGLNLKVDSDTIKKNPVAPWLNQQTHVSI